MSNDNLKVVIKEFDKRAANKPTKEEATQRLQAIGVIDAKGNVTEPYKGVFVKNG